MFFYAGQSDFAQIHMYGDYKNTTLKLYLFGMQNRYLDFREEEDGLFEVIPNTIFCDGVCLFTSVYGKKSDHLPDMFSRIAAREVFAENWRQKYTVVYKTSLDFQAVSLSWKDAAVLCESLNTTLPNLHSRLDWRRVLYV